MTLYSFKNAKKNYLSVVITLKFSKLHYDTVNELNGFSRKENLILKTLCSFRNSIHNNLN